MAQPQLLQSLSDLHNKIENLIEQQKQLQLELETLRERNKVLEELHESDRLKSLQNAKDIEFLSMSHRLASSPDTIVSARHKIIGMIRTINNCIRMINEE